MVEYVTLDFYQCIRYSACFKNAFLCVLIQKGLYVNGKIGTMKQVSWLLQNVYFYIKIFNWTKLINHYLTDIYLYVSI